MGGPVPIGIGLVGANADAGWARAAHIPALAILPQFRLAAVATTNSESAARAAQAFGAEYAFASAAELAACPDVELVAVSVKAPRHFDAALAAIDAGKHVFCEWPMGANAEQSDRLAQAARAAGVRSFVGLQARAAPAVRMARRMVRDGYLGRLHAASMWGAYSYWGTPVATAYSADVASGANVLTIPGGHGIDAMCCVLDDDIAKLSGWQTHFRPEVKAADAPHPVPMTSPDQFAVAGTLQSGALFTAHITGTAPRGETWKLHLAGDKGELLLECDGMPEIMPIRLYGTKDRASPPAPMPIEYPALEGAAGAAFNVAHAWATIAQDLRSGCADAPDFTHGSRRRAQLDAIARSDGIGGMPIEIAPAQAGAAA